jgi:hypothetical protein
MVEGIVVPRKLALLDLLDLFPDLDEGCHKPIQLFLGFTLRRLDHQRAGNRER